MTPHQTSAQPAVAEIAERLTEAQRFAMRHQVPGERRSRCRSRDLRTAAVLHRLGLVESIEYLADLTPLGEAVRAHLEGTPNG